MQAVADTHDTASRPPPALGVGECTIDQRAPSHCSRSVGVALLRKPTAVQAVADTHDTPCNCERFVYGACASDHFTPSQCRTAPASPTAVQSAADTHDTPFPEMYWSRSGDRTTDHFVPSQCSKSNETRVSLALSRLV